jgi:hypothetical protein
VNGELSSDALCQIIERPIVDIRILGKTERVRITARGTSLFCTGNNIVMVGDLCRRIITATLDPELERPELREFKGNPVAAVLANRGAYVAAALTICRAYVVAGRPNLAPRLASARIALAEQRKQAENALITARVGLDSRIKAVLAAESPVERLVADYRVLAREFATRTHVLEFLEQHHALPYETNWRRVGGDLLDGTAPWEAAVIKLSTDPDAPLPS